jgi:hypothetical protein
MDWQDLAGGGVAGAIVALIIFLIRWRREGPMVKAQTAQIAIETDTSRETAEVDNQSQQIRDLMADRADLRTTIREMQKRMDAQDLRIDALEAKNDILRQALASAQIWMHRVREVLTPDQRSQVGPPPDINHLIAPEPR